jgi:hypothetical protein
MLYGNMIFKILYPSRLAKPTALPSAGRAILSRLVERTMYLTIRMTNTQLIWFRQNRAS